VNEMSSQDAKVAQVSPDPLVNTATPPIEDSSTATASPAPESNDLISTTEGVLLSEIYALLLTDIRRNKARRQQQT
jgi:hypothetical protein